MAKQPGNNSVRSDSAPQPEGAGGVTTNRSAPVQNLPPDSAHQATDERKTFYPTENKQREADGDRAYGTFKNAAPTPVPVHSAVRKDSGGAALPRTDASAVQGQLGSPHVPGASPSQSAVKSTAEQNNATGTWASPCQTTVLLGTDGNTSVLSSSAAGVSALQLPFHRRRTA